MVAHLIYNREAGPQTPFPFRDSGPDWLDDTVAYLRTRGATLEATAVTSFAGAAAAAREAAAGGGELVIAAGGDGTLRAVADGLAGTETPLGILPRGTVNVLARELGIPLDDPLTACDICLNGTTRRIDLGRIGDRHFLLMASVGFDAATVGNVNTEIKGVVGTPAYVLSALATLATYNPTDMTLRLDGEVRRAPTFMVVVSNAPSYGGDFKIAPLAALDDGLLDVCIFQAPLALPPVQKAGFLRQIGAVAISRHLQDTDVYYFRARRIEIISEPNAAAQIDGDPAGHTPITIEVRPAALGVRVPTRR